MPCRRFLLLALFLLPALPALARGPDSFAPLVKQVLPSVVNIAVTETVAQRDALAGLPPQLQRPLRERQQKKQVRGAGSGFIIDPSGIIVTNYHVVGNADTIVVSLTDGTQLPARLIGADELTDIAVIKVNHTGKLPSVNFGDSRTLEVGDWVLAAGNPFGLGGSVTAGIVSARGRDLGGAGGVDDFIQIDAPINPGNSGGPLFNTDGQVVGMNTAIYSPNGGSVGIGFAIPSDVISRVVLELRSNGRVERGYLGIGLTDVPNDSGQSVAAGITDVVARGPGARAGLRPGDVILQVNGQQVENARDVIKAVTATAPGKSLRLVLRRQSREQSTDVTVGRRPVNKEGE